MELFFLHNPTVLHKPLFSVPITGKTLPKRNSQVLPCQCSSSSSSDDDTKPTNQSLHSEGRRALIGSLLISAKRIKNTSGGIYNPSQWFKKVHMLLLDIRRYYDLKVGNGTEAVKGSRPYRFDVGQSERGSVLKGLDIGVKGMRVGGQRLLIVPPELAYGSKGVQEIPPNATIELDVELLAIKQSPFGSPVKIVEVIVFSYKETKKKLDLPLAFDEAFSDHCCSSQRTCPDCGSLKVPYPLSTNPGCGDPDYSLTCDPSSKKLYVQALNGSYYLVLHIMPSYQRMVVQPSPWLPGNECVTRDLVVSEGLWLNQSLPFNITSSNTIFLFNCSPRLLVSPLNCTPSSLCHGYLESSGHVDTQRAHKCKRNLNLCCTFVAGGTPSAYKIRLHSSGCKAFRSILHLDTNKPVDQWEEGLEIQWAPPLEPVCRAQIDCSSTSNCSLTARNGRSRCLCNKGYYWDRVLTICVRSKRNTKAGLSLKVSIGVISFFVLAVVISLVTVKRSCRLSEQEKLTKAREDMLKSNDKKSARMFHLKEVKKATNGFSKNRILGSGGFGEVYKGELEDGTTVAVKSAKVGNIKSTEQVLNEVGILSQVNHKNLVRLLGYCVEAEQPLMLYEYISNGTLSEHLHGKISTFLEWKTRLRIALQTAEALGYLHSAAHTPIYHRDVKSTNILLDDEFNAKIADFGLSRLARPGLSHVSTCAQGTLGYLDPEYYRNYQLTDKSDVYSYGVVLLELLTSQKAIDFSRGEDDVNLAIYVSLRVSNGAIMEVVDQRLLGDREPSGNVVESVNLLLDVALACLREKKGDRPTMKDVVQKLQCIIQISDQEVHN
ncbi:hypothetical protein ACLB2K_065749 [Fragaria x ananassa]